MLVPSVQSAQGWPHARRSRDASVPQAAPPRMDSVLVRDVQPAPLPGMDAVSIASRQRLLEHRTNPGLAPRDAARRLQKRSKRRAASPPLPAACPWHRPVRRPLHIRALGLELDALARSFFCVIQSAAKKPESFSEQNTSTSLRARGAELLRTQYAVTQSSPDSRARARQRSAALTPECRGHPCRAIQDSASRGRNETRRARIEHRHQTREGPAEPRTHGPLG